MNLLNLNFYQRTSKKISNFEIIDFCQTLISINYRIELINNLVMKVNQNYDFKRFVLINNKNSICFNHNIDLKNEKDSKLLKRLGEFKSFEPNIDILELKLLLKFYSENSSLIRFFNRYFNRDWSLKKIFKIYLDDGFDEAMNFSKSIFLNEIKTKEHLLKNLNRSFDNIVLERNSYLSQKNEDKQNYIENNINNSLNNIITYDFPMIMYFDKSNGVFENFEFNNFFEDYGFDIRKISHKSPWEIDILTIPNNPIYLLIISIFVIPTSILTIINLYYNIKKNVKDIEKNNRDSEITFKNKIKEFLKFVEKDEAKILEAYKNVRKIKNKKIREAIINLYSELINDFNIKIKKLEMRIVIDGVVKN